MAATGPSSTRRRIIKSPGAFRTISEAASDLEVPQHVLRFWETKFNQVRPLKRGGGRRYYRPEDIALLRRIRNLLYDDGYTIKGVQKVLRDVHRKDDNGETVAATSGRGNTTLSAEKRAQIETSLKELMQIKQILKRTT